MYNRQKSDMLRLRDGGIVIHLRVADELLEGEPDALVVGLGEFSYDVRNFCYFSVIFLDFFEILLKFCRNFWKFHGNPLNLQISMNFRGCRTKPGPKSGQKPSAARLSSPYVALRFWWP